MTVYLQGKPVGVAQTGLDYLSQGQTAFAVLGMPRAVPNSNPAPKKCGPKPKITKVQESARALETSGERAERQAAERQKAMAAILRKNSYSDVARATDADKTGRIQGRRNAARSQ